MKEAMIPRRQAVDEVRLMAEQFADMYFAFCQELRRLHGEQAALEIAQRVLYFRAMERARAMIERAAREGVERTPAAIHDMSDVPYLGWDASLGRAHCPYGAAWNRRIAENEWFRPFAALYCDVTDTTIAEEFTGAFTHRLIHNVVLGDESCERIYTADTTVRDGRRTYAP